MNILICDDHPIVCSGVEEVLNAIFDNLNIVKAFDIDSAITYLNTEEYDYLFLDLHFQERNVTEILNIIQFPQKVYIFTSTDNYQLLKTVLNYDVLGIIHKSTDLALLPSILKSKDTPYLDPLFQSIMEKNKHFDLLTNKELEILSYIIQDGLTNKEISNVLECSVETVKTHRANILRKTESSCRSDLFDWYYQR